MRWLCLVCVVVACGLATDSEAGVFKRRQSHASPCANGMCAVPKAVPQVFEAPVKTPLPAPTAEMPVIRNEHRTDPAGLKLERNVPPAIEVQPIEEALLAATNAERARHGLHPLKLSIKLLKTSRKHTYWMMRNRSLQHGNYLCAENIAMGQRSVPEVVHCWMNSSGHRANILNRGHRFVGLTRYITPHGTAYWCQQFTR